MSKEERIQKEVKRLTGLFENIEPKLKKIVTPLVEKAGFMQITLEDLQSYINENGVTEEYQNGKEQWGIKKSPQVEIYNTMIKNYSAIIRQLTDLLPKEVQKEEDDGFAEFVNRKL